jgi:hypothetical protein
MKLRKKAVYWFRNALFQMTHGLEFSYDSDVRENDVVYDILGNPCISDKMFEIFIIT